MIATMARQLARASLYAHLRAFGTRLCAGALILALTVAGCGGGGSSSPASSGPPGGGNPVLQSIDVSPPDPSVAVGNTLTLAAIGHYSDGSTEELSSAVWASGTKSVATVDLGLLSALATGSSTVTASLGNIQGTTTVTVTAGAAAVSYLWSFGSVANDGSQPNGPLLQASDGNFYGTTRAGGGNTCQAQPDFCGTLFKITPAGIESVIYAFGASASDGNDPNAPLIQGSDGSFYGTTALGGANGDGTVFKITPAGIETVLYSFGASASDGIVPAGLILGSDGNFYGTTNNGGAHYCAAIPTSSNNCGTVFKITPAGVETVLYSFGASATDGFEPLAPLVQANDGNFYGTTSGGGANGFGTVFKITPAGVETVLYAFGASPSNGSPAQGSAPQGSLIQARDGNLYGTTVSGGAHSNCQYGCGTVFRITLSGTLSVLYSFAGSPTSDGYGPAPFLIEGKDGNFYGTTYSGGAFGGDLNGTVFRITPAGIETVLYSFGPLDVNPSDPIAGVIQGSDGAFYGVTDSSAGGSPAGTLFKLVPTP